VCGWRRAILYTLPHPTPSPFVSSAAEVAGLVRARAADTAHYDGRLSEALGDLRRIADEARGREAAHATELSRKAEEVLAVRREAEAAAARLQVRGGGR
jgi:hypothetical protein